MAEIDSSQIKFPAYMVYCVFIACLGSFSNGWVIGSPNVPGEITHHCLNGNAHVQNSLFPDCLPMDDALWGFAVASFCVGGLLGGLSGGMIQTRLGRKRTIMLNNLGFIFGGILIATAVNSSIFFIVIGILLSSVIGLPLATVSLWRVNYVIIAAPAIIQFFLMNTCVESPRYLVSINRIEEAKAILQKLRGKASIDVEFYDILEGSLGTAIAQLMIKQYGLSDTLKKDQEADINEELIVIPPQASETMNVIQVFMDPVIRRIALTVIGLHAFQQLVGINAVMYYSTTIFNLAFDQETSKYMTIITTAVNFVMTILAVVLVDRMGRRPLLLVANMGACLFCILLVIGYVYNIPALLVVSVFTYVASFAIGIGPIPWLITSELTPTYASSSVGSLGTCVNWSVNFLIGQCFPVIFAHIAGYSFVIFAVFAALSFLFTLFFLPETKGRSLESIVRGYERYRN
ncbi:hypothetical protein G6F53_008989 [Rhizopus delemar]|nr:hypothetical protein G6F53_008989 [Rhizopus delemar]